MFFHVSVSSFQTRTIDLDETFKTPSTCVIYPSRGLEDEFQSPFPRFISGMYYGIIAENLNRISNPCISLPIERHCILPAFCWQYDHIARRSNHGIWQDDLFISGSKINT